MQTAISSATFAAANSLLVAIGVPWALGIPSLVWPMLAGAGIATFIDGTMLYGMFNTRAYPASGSWPAGVATAEALWAGDRGGKKLLTLGAGFVVGAGGAYFGIPMASAGIAFIGSVFALFMFAMGLLIRGYSSSGFIPFDIYANYLPHGFMIGAGLVALYQVCMIIFKKRRNGMLSDETAEKKSESDSVKVKKTLSKGFLLYFGTALILAFTAKIFTTMSFPMLIGFLFFAAFAAIVQEMIVGMAAMHSGWFPATAAALISLVIGMLIGFPPEALGVLVGFCVATGPSFADLGFDMKTGYMIRGSNADPARENYGRRQQYFAAMIGFFFAILVVAGVHEIYFSMDKIVPASRLYAATIEAGSSSEIARKLLIWAIPGALLQYVGGSRNQLGILFSTGLMINFPVAGWTVIVTLIIRTTLEKFFKIGIAQTSSFAGGLIAGDALFSAFRVLGPIAKTKLLGLFIR